MVCSFGRVLRPRSKRGWKTAHYTSSDKAQTTRGGQKPKSASKYRGETSRRAWRSGDCSGLDIVSFCAQYLFFYREGLSMRFDILTLKTRLMVAVGIPCLALILVAATSLSSMRSMQQQALALYVNTAAPLRAMAEAASRIPRMRVGIDMMLLQETGLRDEKGVKTRVQEALSEDVPGMRTAMQAAVTAQVSPERRLQAQQLLDQFEVMVRDELMPLLHALESGDTARAQQIYREQYAKSYGVMRKAAGEQLDALLQQAQQQSQSSRDSYRDGRNRQLTIIALGLLVSCLTAGLIVFSLRRRVTVLHDSLSAAAEHLSLSTPIELDGKDELADIAQSFNRFIEKIHGSMLLLADEARQLAQRAGEVTGRAKNTQDNCVAQTERTVLVATAIHELNSTVNEIAGNAECAAQVARQAAQSATDGHTVVKQTREQIEALNADLTHVSGVVEALANQIAAISATLGTIRSISEQTNLLALNAAIEAARAGEHGRGFAVVADEVRTLASRSGASTEEIQQIIDRLQSESRAAVEAMGKGRQQSATVVEHANRMALVLEQINEHISQLSDQNILVATATEEQSTVVEEINRNVEQINLFTQETASIADQLHQSSSHLQGLSGKMDEQLGCFKL
jgi:methyl-accepting chemotaxis protein